MANPLNTYQCAIIGGGLAGLCLSIQLANKGYRVVLFEKNQYPFHKVCGEYVSNESYPFLESLGLPLADMRLPKINHLGISSTTGFMLKAPLQMGGFGISRYTLDHQLYLIAKRVGVEVLQNCKVHDVTENKNNYEINTSNGLYHSQIVCGSYGKINPVFINKTENKNTKKYVGVKYHIKTNLANNQIELHNFKDGYCGISKVDNDTYCLCYLTTAKNLQKNKSIKQLEENVLYKNPFLKTYFTASEFLFSEPLTVSQISFNKKSTYSNGIFLLGDASGAIAPLCGNGMSMGMRASKILTELIDAYFKKEISKTELINLYKKKWDSHFSTRIKAGYYLQQLFGKNTITHFSLKLLSFMPKTLQKLISLTHGKTF